MISPDSPQAFGNILLVKNECVRWLMELAAAVHAHGAAVMIQLTHLGRRTAWNKADWLPVLAPSPVREPAHRAFPKAIEDWDIERIVADYAGTGLTVGRHPMALRRDELATRGVMRACDLRSARHGRRVRVAGMVITRQRPGTAKGFVFLTLEDETGVANIIVRPDLFARDRLVITEEPFLIVDGVLQNQDGVTSVRAEQIRGMRGAGDRGADDIDDIDFDAHNFY